MASKNWPGHIRRNLILLDQIDEMGVDRTLSVPADHFAYFPDEAKGREFSDWCRSCGYEVANEGDREGLWGVALVIHHDLTDATVGRVCSQLDTKADELGGDYDGWGAPVSPPEKPASPSKKSWLRRLFGG